jgi:hypothetical protein
MHFFLDVPMDLLMISAKQIISFFGTHFLGPLLLVFFFPEVLGTLGA